MSDPGRIWAVDPFAAVLDLATNVLPALVGRDLVLPTASGDARGHLEDLKVEPPVSMTGVAGDVLGLIGRLGAGLQRTPAIGAVAGRARSLLGGTLVLAASARAVLSAFEVPGEPAGRRMREVTVTADELAVRIGTRPELTARLVRVHARLGEHDLQGWLVGTPAAGVRLVGPDRVAIPWTKGGRLTERASLEVEPRLQGDRVVLRPMALRLGNRRVSPPRTLADRLEVNLPRLGPDVRITTIEVFADHVRVDLEIRNWREPITLEQIQNLQFQLAGRVAGEAVRIMRVGVGADRPTPGDRPGPGPSSDDPTGDTPT